MAKKKRASRPARGRAAYCEGPRKGQLGKAYFMGCSLRIFPKAGIPGYGLLGARGGYPVAASRNTVPERHLCRKRYRRNFHYNFKGIYTGSQALTKYPEMTGSPLCEFLTGLFSSGLVWVLAFTGSRCPRRFRAGRRMHG